jgi:alpha-galactosidase
MNCYARLDGDTLIVGNPVLERRWRVVDGTLQASSIRAGDREWLLAPVASPAPCTATLTTTIGRAGPTEAESLVAELVTNSRRYRLQIFPDSAGIILQSLNPNTAAAAAPAGAVASGIERPATAEELPAADRLEDWQLPAPHLRLTQVRLLDQTDIHNELVFENEWLLHPNEAWLELTGNLFLLEDTLTGDGLICLKLGPLPHARPVKSAADLRVSGTGMCHYKAGQSLAYRLALYGTQYPAALLAYQRGGRTAVLQQFQRQFRRLAPRFLSNTWGDRSRDARINEPFLLAEIEAGAQLGVDVVQIDDGWQRGRTANSAVPGGVWEGFWATDANFWDAHPAGHRGGAGERNGVRVVVWPRQRE